MARRCSTASSRSGTRSRRFSTRESLFFVLASSLVGVIIGALPGPHRDDGRGADDHAHDQDAVEAGAAGADLHLRRRDLRRLALGDPAQHSRHAGLGRLVPRRLRARAAGPRRPRDGHRHHRLGAGHADRHVLPRAVHADPRRPRAQVRRVRVLLAGDLRRDHLRQRSPATIRSRAGSPASSACSSPAVGQEGIYAYERFTFGIRDLAGGLSLVPALVGAFGFAELLVVDARAAAAGEDESRSTR